MGHITVISKERSELTFKAHRIQADAEGYQRINVESYKVGLDTSSAYHL